VHAVRIDALALDPRPPASKKLPGGEDLYRIRVGDYRVIYQVQARIVVVTVIRIGHRRDIYR
jgi:mRNA interferase RelE/StbE